MKVLCAKYNFKSRFWALGGKDVIMCGDVIWAGNVMCDVGDVMCDAGDVTRGTWASYQAHSGGGN